MNCVTISIIIPAYNATRFIADAINSILAQSYSGAKEIIIIDDASTDGTADCVRNIFASHPRLDGVTWQLISYPVNRGQGAARNHGMQIATGEYIFFLDADDMLAADGLDSMCREAERTGADIVACDWIYYYTTHFQEYVIINTYQGDQLLQNEHCERLLDAHAYFSVNKLYKRKFLLQYNIKYGEGFIFEDWPFIVNSLQHAEMIAILPNPLYFVRVNPYSSSRSNRSSIFHYHSFEKAAHACAEVFSPRHRESGFYLHKRILGKVLLMMADKRFSAVEKQKLADNILASIRSTDTTYTLSPKATLAEQIFFGYGLIKIHSHVPVQILALLQKTQVRCFRIGDKSTNNKPVIFSDHFSTKVYRKRTKVAFTKVQNPEVISTILILGCNYQYSGNSKHLFDYLQSSGLKAKIRYATRNTRVPEKHRVLPYSKSFYRLLSSARIVFLEGWSPVDVIKPNHSIWIQLWHGLGCKRLFFDSHERELTGDDPWRKRRLHKDVLNWDYFLAGSSTSAKIIQRSLLVHPDRIIHCRAPRVQWMIENKQNPQLLLSIRRKLCIDDDKPIILYAPSWREYNLNVRNRDLSYLLDTQQLSDRLGQKYHIITCGSITSSAKSMGTQLPDLEELLLVSSVLISDYSSLIFDAIQLDIPIAIYATDTDRMHESPGLIPELWNLLEPYRTDDLYQIDSRIEMGKAAVKSETYAKLKDILGHNRPPVDHLIELAKKALDPKFSPQYATGRIGRVVSEINRVSTSMNRKLYIFGAGKGGQRIYDQLHRLGVTINAFIDNDLRKKGQSLCGLPVMPPRDLNKTAETVIVVASMWREDIVKQLRTMGYEDNQLIAADDLAKIDN